MKLDKLIAAPVPKMTLLYRKGNTKNIISVVLQTLTANRDDVKKLSKQFESSYDGLRDLYDFVKSNFTYRIDPDGGQWIQTPAVFWHLSRIGDCKSFTVFIASVLHHMGLPYLIRFVSYDDSKTPSHVYPVAILDGKEVILDAVYWGFDREDRYSYKKDFVLKSYVV